MPGRRTWQLPRLRPEEYVTRCRMHTQSIHVVAVYLSFHTALLSPGGMVTTTHALVYKVSSVACLRQLRSCKAGGKTHLIAIRHVGARSAICSHIGDPDNVFWHRHILEVVRHPTRWIFVIAVDTIGRLQVGADQMDPTSADAGNINGLARRIRD